MSRPRIKTMPDLAIDSPKHQEAIAAGNDHFRSWSDPRNIIDEFKGKSNEEIKDILQQTAFPYAVCFENLINDFNISSGLRNANVFNAKETFYIGDKRFDKRGLQGCHNYMNITWLSTIDEFMALETKYKIVGFDNIPGAIPLYNYAWEENTLIVFGSEGVGLSEGMKKMCKEFVYIPQRGSIRSLNVATASGIAMNDIVHKLTNKV